MNNLPESSITARLVEVEQLRDRSVTFNVAVRRVAVEFKATIAEVKEALDNQ